MLFFLKTNFGIDPKTFEISEEQYALENNLSEHRDCLYPLFLEDGNIRIDHSVMTLHESFELSKLFRKAVSKKLKTQSQ